MTAAAFLLCLLLLALAAAAGAGLVSRALRDDPDEVRVAQVSVAFGPVVGLVVAALPGWVLLAPAWLSARSGGAPGGFFSSVPVDRVLLPLWLLTLAAALILSWDRLKRLLRRESLVPLVVLLAVFGFFLWLRWAPGEIRQTEKPMDFAVLARLVTQPALPLSDPWFAGEIFTYYHFGTYVFSLPVRLSGLAPEYAYNLIAAGLAGLLSAGAWGTVRLRGGGPAVALFGALLLPLAGTPDGLFQLMGEKKLGEIDVWLSSRRVDNPHTITEWPLFTLWLGDLHPHAVSMPLFVVFMGLAGTGGLLLQSALLAGLLSANPWDLPAALLMLAAGNLASRDFWPAALRSVWTVALSVPFLLTFLLSPRPPSGGLRTVAKFTQSWEAFLHFGVLLAVPALAFGIALARSRPREDESFLAATGFPALGIALAIVSGRPVLGLAVAFVAGVAWLSFRRDRLEGALRAGFLVAAAGAVLVSVPEVVALKDTYGEQMHRMNTVFKCYSGGAILLGVASALLLPLALSTRRARLTIRLLLTLAVLAALAHPLNASRNRFKAHSSPVPLHRGSLDGLAWLSNDYPGDRQAISWLRKNAPPDAFIAEAPGGGYSDHGRIGTASGRPTVLGWANHEMVWRGDSGSQELAARQKDLATIYKSIELPEVQEVLARRRIRYVVVGPIERKDFGDGAFPTKASFRQVFSAAGTELYEVGP